ncbi:aldolase [Violaceomyces palustris]|uniref:Aldolase n=1 Tax=Violaceomyces palustris TaxID=1673888 RepID=A0ACD0P4S3_9BASI|nr:aldolase [Violaceomyces palustris]
MTMSSQGLTGILAAVPTPFSKDGSTIDTRVIQQIVDRMVSAGVHGIVTTGTTGEFPTLSEAEHKQVVEAYVKASRGRIPIIAGVGSNSTKVAIELSLHAQEAGVQAVMVVPPFYDPLPFGTLKRFFSDLCSSIRVPVIYYNLPGATGIHLTASQIRELAEIRGFDYLKDTSGNAKELADLLTNPVENFQAFNGWDTLTFFAFCHGAKASVWGVASLVPEESVEFYKTLVLEKDLEKAREQWKFLWKVSDFLESVNYPAGIKAGLKILGRDAGPTRLPTLPLEEKEIERLEKILAERK